MYQSRTAAFYFLGIIFVLIPSGSVFAAGKVADLMCFSGSEYDYSCPWKTGQKEIVNNKEVICMQGKPCEDSDVKGGCINADFCGGETFISNGVPGKCSLQPLKPLTTQSATQLQPTSPTQNSQPALPPLANQSSILMDALQKAPSNMGQESIAPSANSFEQYLLNNTDLLSNQAPPATPGTGVAPDSGASVFSHQNLTENSPQLQGGSLEGVQQVTLVPTKETGGATGPDTFVPQSDGLMNYGGTDQTNTFQQTPTASTANDCGWTCALGNAWDSLKSTANDFFGIKEAQSADRIATVTTDANGMCFSDGRPCVTAIQKVDPASVLNDRNRLQRFAGGEQRARWSS